jgi:hypothetical protein
LSPKQNTYFEARKLNVANESTVATKFVQNKIREPAIMKYYE